MSRVKIAVRRALDDSALAAAVLNSCILSTIKRDQAIAELPDFEDLRRQARAVREKIFTGLEPLLDQFTRSFTAAGGVVHQASDDREARRIVLDLLERRRVRQGVKSKSMVAAEIGLGEALASAGIDAVESDLGEFIVQLAGEPPSHITAPALHRSRQSIGRLFAQKLKILYTDDPAALTRAARTHLRQRFLKSEFGLAGANFVVAESGHIVLVENEGNGRLGYSLPPLFIAITGIEKVIPALPDLAPLLRLLARSATGQRFTSYTSLIRPAQLQEDGPREMHIVLVDNGRREALGRRDLREMMLCIRCGACLNVCPVYRTVGGHAYGSVYPGPMGAVWSNLVGKPSAAKAELPDLSTLCGACREVCPVDIDIPRMLLELRARRPKSALESVAAAVWQWTMETPAHYELAGKAAHTAGMLLPGGLQGGWPGRGGEAFRDGDESPPSIEEGAGGVAVAGSPPESPK